MWSSIFGSSTPEQQFDYNIKFSINGINYTLENDIPTDLDLNSYIRNVANLKGTKSMCFKGGCGACLVNATVKHPVTAEQETFAVHSCLLSPFQCDGWEITTIEGLGDRKSGYHAIQATLARYNGTQCGYCSPGMVMNMRALLESGKPVTMATVENSFSGNLCRCTGYRPILDAFKSLATDASPELKQKCIDIEDIYKICEKTGEACKGSCASIADHSNLPVRIRSGNMTWYKVRSLKGLFGIIDSLGGAEYTLVAGNTAKGALGKAVYPTQEAEVLIDIKDVPELRTTVKSPEFKMGANTTITEAIQIFDNNASVKGFKYMATLADHLRLMANVPKRNIATIAGNLVLKNTHPEFPSDVFTIFNAIGAQLNIMSQSRSPFVVSMDEFLTMDVRRQVILSVTFPKFTSSSYVFETFRVAPRKQNALAHVNAGFLLKFGNTKWTISSQPRIVYGGICRTFTRATKTEKILLGKNILDPSSILLALEKLQNELIPSNDPQLASPEYRKNLAVSLFYRFILGLDTSKVAAKFISGSKNLERPLSSGKQEFETDKSVWPLNEPIPKLDAILQCAGEAEFVNDIPKYPGELFISFVITSFASGSIKSVDASLALADPKVIDFISHVAMTNANTFTPTDFFGYTEEEEVFCSGKVRFAGQAIGVIVATSKRAAMEAVKKVVVKYEATEKPILSINEVLSKSKDRINSEAQAQDSTKNVTDDPTQTIKGTFEIGKQYHFHMETQACLVIPKEDSIDIFVPSQWKASLQTVVARALDIPACNVNVTVRRLGGAYGAKITRTNQIAVACAITAKKFNRPVRCVLSLEDNMIMFGKRFSARHEYEVEVKKNGKIVNLQSKMYLDNGAHLNDSLVFLSLLFLSNCYESSGWVKEAVKIRTDTVTSTYCRAPGTLEGITFIEEVMERVAQTLKLDPLSVRMANLDANDTNMAEMIAEIKTKSDYEARLSNVKKFNSNNRWKKKGICIMPMKYPIDFFDRFASLVSVYRTDGSVAITHGGVEMGQGINTKVAQVAAHTLGIPLDKVSVKPSNSLCAPNCFSTTGSVSGESTSFATQMACEIILERLEPIKIKLVSPTWEEVIKEAFVQGVELTATYTFTKINDAHKMSAYPVYGVAVTEAEVDVLTGQYQIARVDILEDVGKSLSPMIDVGQIEGAFVMGMGYWLTEEIKFEQSTGRLLNTDTWTYKPPGALDIPIDFRVYFRKDSPNPLTVLQSKATGEPALVLAASCYWAIHYALRSARRETGAYDYFTLKQPATVEKVLLASLTNPNQFKLK